MTVKTNKTEKIYIRNIKFQAVTGGSKKRKGGQNSIVQKKQKLSNGAAQENSLIAKTKKKKEAEQSLTKTLGNPNEIGVHHKKNKNKYKEINEEQKRKKENDGNIKWHPSRCVPDADIADNKVTKVLEVEEKKGGTEESLEGIKKKRKIAEINNKDIKDEDAGFIPQDKEVAGLTNGTLEVKNGALPGKNKKQKKKNKKTLEKCKVENDDTLAGPITGSDLNTRKLKKKGENPL